MLMKICLGLINIRGAGSTVIPLTPSMGLKPTKKIKISRKPVNIVKY